MTYITTRFSDFNKYLLLIQNGFHDRNTDLSFDALNNYLLKKMYCISLRFYQEILMVQCIFRKDIKASKTF